MEEWTNNEVLFLTPGIFTTGGKKNNRSFNMVKTSAQPYKHMINVYVYN